MDNLSTIIHELSNYKRILVTGPNRSGTTMFSRELGKILGYRVYDEADYRYHEGVFKHYFKFNNVVIQGPGLSYLSHRLVDEFNDSIVVFMIRDVADIGNSSKRIRGEVSSAEMRKNFDRVLNRYLNEGELIEAVQKELPIIDFTYSSSAQFRYAVWNSRQKNLCSRYREIPYDRLKELPGFVTAEQRVDFGPKRTTTVVKRETFTFRLLKRFYARAKFEVLKFKALYLDRS